VAGKQHTAQFDKLIIAIGRVPVTQGLGADKVGLAIDERGFIAVDDECRTNLPNVWAIGDVVRGPMLAHKASEEGVAVAERIAGQKPQVDLGNVPFVIYTDPEIAWVGKTEEQLQAAGIAYKKGTSGFGANGRALGLGKAKGSYDIIDPMDHVNASQSTNDAYPTGFRLAVYNSTVAMMAQMNRLKQAFEAKAEEFKDVLKMGRTQLQDAVPMSLGQEFKAFAVLLEEENFNLQRNIDLLLEINLGATAIGTGVNTPKGYAALAVKKLSEVSGLDCKLTENLIEATSDCGAYVMVHGALKRTAVKLSKICNDLRLLSSGPRAGLKEINLPEMQAGSSIMPAKVNPVIPEVVNQVCFKVIGNDTTITFAAEAGQLQLNVMEPVIAQCMFETISLLGNAAVNLAEKCVKGITVNREICERYVFNSIGLVTYLNPYIGHENGDLVGKICAQTGKGVREVVLERGLLSEAELDRILSPENLMNPHL